MLRLARQRRGFQQGEAAKSIGVAQATLSRVESGLIEPSESLLDGAAKCYQIPRSFFFQQDQVYGAPVSVHPMWRRKADVSIADMDRIVAELNVRVMHLRRLLDAAEIDTGAGMPSLDVESYDGDVERIAGIVRAHWKVPSGPIRDLTALIERAGVVVVHSNLGGSEVSGVTFSVPGMPPLIVLNQNQPADRLRFTLAHELGHLVMHRFPTPNMEEEANKFAGALLMPASEIRPYFTGRRVDFALLAALKPEWRVSMQSLLMRARTVGAVSPNQERYLWQQFSARGIRTHGEPPELDFPREMSSIVQKLLKIHSEYLNYSSQDLANFLHMYSHELVAFHSLKLSDGGDRPRLRVV